MKKENKSTKYKGLELLALDYIKDLLIALRDDSIDWREIRAEEAEETVKHWFKYLRKEDLEWAALSLLEYIDDPSDKIRNHIAQAFGEAVDELSRIDRENLTSIISKLIERLNERNDRVRESIAWTIFKFSQKYPELFKDKINMLLNELKRPCGQHIKPEKPQHRHIFPTPLLLLERRYSHHYEDEFPDRCQNARTLIAYTIRNIVEKFPEFLKDEISVLTNLLQSFLRDQNEQIAEIGLEMLKNISKRKPEIVRHVIPDLVTCLSHESTWIDATYILRDHAEANVDILKNEIDELLEALMDYCKKDEAECLAEIIHTIWKKYPNQVEEKIEKIWDKLNEYTIETIEWLALESSKMVLKLTPKLKENLYNETYNEIYQELSTSAALTLLYIGIDYPQLIEDTLPKITEYLTHPYEEVYENLSDNLTILIKKHPQTINKILPKLLQILPKLLTNKKYSKHHITKIANLLKTITTTKPETLNKITPLLNKLNKTDNETRRKIKLILEKINNTQKQK